MNLGAHFNRVRISRWLVSILVLSLLTSIGLTPNFSSTASAAIVGTAPCTVDGTNMLASNVIDSTTVDGTCMVRLTSGTSSFIIPTGINTVAALVVGGGGGGGFGSLGGGGGAGSVISTTSGVAVSSGAEISVSIGGGGAPGISTANVNDQANWGPGANGETSTLTIAGIQYLATGGGGGGGGGTNPSIYRIKGETGGSGGGSAVGGTGGGAYNINYAGWSESASAGYSAPSGNGGGGGGAKTAATNSNGAEGVTIFGYKVGGGGSGYLYSDSTAARVFGGGATRNSSFLCPSNSCNGIANTGGGGGAGGAGGSGLVVVKFIPSSGQGTIAQSNGFQVNRSATFTFTRTGTAPTSTSATYQWQVKPAGSSIWSNVTTGTGGTTNAYQTGTLVPSDDGNSYRVAVTDSSSTYGISTTTFTEVSAQSLFTPPGGETDTALTASSAQHFYAANASKIFPEPISTLSLEAWVKPGSTCDGNNFCTVFSIEYSFLLDVYQGKISYIIGSGSAWCNASSRSNLAGTSIPSGQWSHIALVRSSTNVKIFVNGALVSNLNSSCSPTTMTASASYKFGIGSRNGTSEFFNGQIDEAKIWTTDRSANITSDMNSNQHSVDGLIGYWNFNEGTGSVAYNQVRTATSSSDLTSDAATPENLWNSVSISTSSAYGAYTVRTFYRSYITTNGGWKVPAGVTQASALVIAGGGGGGSDEGGGGGGGGFLESTLTSFSSDYLTVQVGQGGLGATGADELTKGANGQNSVFSSLTAVGGGGGGSSVNTNGSSLRTGSLGGSGGGGAGENYTPNSGGSGTAGQGFKGGDVVPSSTARGAGGGGAGAAGGATGTGGAGKASSISGTSVFYAGGGGGGHGNTAGGSVGAGGTGGGGAGGDLDTPSTDGTPNTGGGGGGGCGNIACGDWNTAYSGASGGSGIIIIRWITATAPIFTGPSSDTLTAGMVETFTVTGAPISPLTRSYRWQFSSDTGTSWTTLQASTSDSYTTTTLETTTSGSRYSYRVIVTDSDTAGLSISESSTFTLVINPRITITGSSVSLTQKYGETQTVTYTIANGTGTRTTAASPNNRTGITWSSVSGSSATLSIASNLGFGTYYETLTVTDSVTATTSQMITIAISKADTITVTMNSPTALNYTGSTASFTPTVTFGGLKSTDTATASSVTITQTRAGNTCAMGGTCAIGDRGPGGGIVFITPSTVSGNGKYFEAAPDAWYGANDLSTVGKFCTAASNRDDTPEGATEFGIGWGETNTAIFRVNCTGGAVKLATDYRGGGFSNWFVPSADELDEMRAYYTTVDLIKVDGYWGYWSSSEYSSSVMKTLDNSGIWKMGEVNKSDSTHNMVRPVRMFTACHSVDSCTAFSSTTMPTNAGTYRLTPSALTLSSGDLANYQGVTYASGLLTINKVNQTPITIGQYDAFPGVSTYPLNVYGGSGTGVMRRTLTSAGTASCVLTNIMFITASTPGKCEVRVTKAADFNFNMESATATIYWIQFVDRYTNPGPTSPTDLGLSGGTAMEKRTYETFTVLSFADETGTAVTSIRANTKLRVIGTGFVAADGTTEVYFGMASVPHSGLTFNTLDPMANYVLLTVPADAETDRVLMYSAKDWATSPGTLTILP